MSEYWHFIAEDRRLRFGNHELVEEGKTYRTDGEPVLCHRGLHASERALDALDYAPGPIICRVTLGEMIVHGEDKSAATERTVLWMADATETLGSFARWCALQVIDTWGAPDVVRQYLETGDASIKNVALEVARGALSVARGALSASALVSRGVRDANVAAVLVSRGVRDATLAATLASCGVRDVSGGARAAAMSTSWRTPGPHAWDDMAASWDTARAAQNTELTRRLLMLKPTESP